MEGCRNNPPKVLSVGCCDQPTLFHKVTIPAAVGDETTDPPLPGKFRNVLLVYEATSNAYLYSSDGIPTQISDTGEINRLEKLIKAEEEARKEADDALDDAILDETDARITADEDIWTEIRTIEAASDVVDVVGTYAELEAYDTSKLHDNDLIKVLQDETHGDAITYYRWSTATEQFSYVGEQGPYYTQAQTNALLDDKQDVLTAGDNIQISGNVISATDTTYTAGTGISIDSSNVISSTASGVATLYVGSSSNEYRFYHDSVKTELVTYQEMAQLLEAQSVRLVLSDGSAADVAAYSIGSSELRIFSYDSGMYRSYRWFSSNQYASLTAHYLQDALTAGDNITISGNVISATDTTYTAGTGLSLTGTEFAVDTTVIAEKSDIPTVNDATLTIQKNGTTVQTFTANQASNATANITVPTATSDLTNDSGFITSASLPTKTSDLTNDGSDGTSTYVEASDLATVATSGSYMDLTNTPTIPAAQVNSDWNASSGVAEILNKPTLATVATSGAYSDLSGTPTIPTATSDLTNDSGFITSSDLPGDMAGATSGTAGAHGLVPAPAAGDQNKVLSGAGTWVAVSSGGSYSAGNGISIDANNEISIDSSVVAEVSDIPTQTSDLTNDGADGTSTYVEADELAAVATSGSYTDLTNTPSIPAAQVNSDWNAVSGVAEILNKPSLATVATTGAYSDLSGTPTIPTVNDATLTITQNGTSAGTFTANSATNTTIALTDTTYSAFTGTDGQTAGTAGLVPAPATTDAGKFLKADGTWDTAGGGTLYSTTGRNTDGAMTQRAITDALFAQGYDPATSPSDVRIAIGGTTYNPTTVQQIDGIAIGPGAKSNGWKSIAIGLASENLDNGTGQIAIGTAKTKGATSVAIGEGAEAKGGTYTGGALAIGGSAKVDLSSVNFPVGAVAIGSRSTTSEDLTVSVGQAPDSQSEGIYRRIVNVADATTAHDAVTKGQLDAVAASIPTTNNISSNDWSGLWQ